MRRAAANKMWPEPQEMSATRKARRPCVASREWRVASGDEDQMEASCEWRVASGRESQSSAGCCGVRFVCGPRPDGVLEFDAPEWMSG